LETNITFLPIEQLGGTSFPSPKNSDINSGGIFTEQNIFSRKDLQREPTSFNHKKKGSLALLTSPI